VNGSTSEVNLKIVKFCVGQVFAIVVQVFARVGTFRDYATLTTHRVRTSELGSRPAQCFDTQAKDRLQMWSSDVNRWDENAGLRRDAIRSQVIDALEAQEIKETGNEED
jgi:hypothetical protein